MMWGGRPGYRGAFGRRMGLGIGGPWMMRPRMMMRPGVGMGLGRGFGYGAGCCALPVLGSLAILGLTTGLCLQKMRHRTDHA
jgi:hypothetical protein